MRKVEVLRDYGYVDARGMGVRIKVMPALKAIGVKSALDATEDYLRVVVGKASEKVTTVATFMSDKKVKIVGKTSEKILSAIRDKADITISELAEVIGVTPRSVERHLQKLQQRGLLTRMGGRKQGHWELIG